MEEDIFNNRPTSEINCQSDQQQSQPFDQLVASSKLPTIIKYDARQEVDPNLIGPGFDPSQAYLLHSCHQVRRMLARTARFQPSTKSFHDSGFDVTVDQQYNGWFAVLGSPSEHGSDPVVPHYRSIGKLSISPCETFLVSGTLPLDGMKVSRHDDGTKSLKPFNILPGAVLTKVGMYTVSYKVKVKKNFLKSKTVHKEETYLACRDERQEEILIPCQASGIFYVLTQVSGQIKTPVMRMEDIMTRYKFPLLVKLVHGIVVEKPSSCNGTFVLLKSQQAKTSFASTLYAPLPVTVEIVADSSLRFYDLNASNAMDLENTNNDSAVSKTYRSFSDKMPSLLQTMRIRNSEQGLTSARSSSTSGHGSCLSDDEERLDWGQAAACAVCSNSPFIEIVDTMERSGSTFTHHANNNNSQTPKLQTQISLSGKDTKNKNTPKLKKQLSSEKMTTVATAIKRTRVYDSPIANPGSIPITVKRSSSQCTDGDNSNAATLQIRYENDHNNNTNNNNRNSPTSPNSPASGAVMSSPELDNAPTEYTTLWSDTSSVTSGESMEVVVETVMHTDVAGNTQDALSAHQYKNLSSELAATVRLRNKRRPSLLTSIVTTTDETEDRNPDDENTYDVLSDNPYRNTIRGSYHTLQPPSGGDPSVAPPGVESPGDDHEVRGAGEENAMGAQVPAFTQRNPSITSTGTYEEPMYGNYERARGGTYERPRMFTGTGTYEKSDNLENFDLSRTGTYVKPQSGFYDRPSSGSYVTPTPQNYDEPGNTRTSHSDPYQDDDIVYETMENIYESIADLDAPPPPPVHYVNVPTSSSDYTNADDIGSGTTMTSYSSPSSHDAYVHSTTLTPNTKPSNNSDGLYLNTPPSHVEDDVCATRILETLLSSMSGLGLKPSTEDMIRSVDPQNFDFSFSPTEDASRRDQLKELFPVMNQIDLNKVSLFIDGNVRSL